MASPAGILLSGPADATTARGHIPVLDGVRGLAILMVLVIHFVGNAVPTNRLEEGVIRTAGWGRYGVDLFFVLSGFLITGILFDARGKSHYFRNFYVRRVLRIFPLYYGVLALVFFVCPLLPPLRGPTLQTLRDHQWWAWFYGVNIYEALRGEWALLYLRHFWSLAVEEHFYFVWPVVVWFLAPRPGRLMGTCLVVAGAALLARVVASVAGANEIALYVLTPFRLDGLALGGFVAVLARQPGGREGLSRALPRVAVASAALFLFSSGWKRLGYGGTKVLVPVRESLVTFLLACLLVWALTAERRSPVRRFLSSRAMVFLGTYSYGLYVYHHFFAYYLARHRTEFILARALGSHSLAVALQATVGSVLSIGVAFLSYHLFEKRFLELKERFSGHTTRGGRVF